MKAIQESLNKGEQKGKIRIKKRRGKREYWLSQDGEMLEDGLFCILVSKFSIR